MPVAEPTPSPYPFWYKSSRGPVFYVLAPSLLSWAYSGVSTEQAWSLLSWSVFYLANCSLLSPCSRACPEQAPSDLMRQPNSLSVIFSMNTYNVYFWCRRHGINNNEVCISLTVISLNGQAMRATTQYLSENCTPVSVLEPYAHSNPILPQDPSKTRSLVLVSVTLTNRPLPHSWAMTLKLLQETLTVVKEIAVGLPHFTSPWFQTLWPSVKADWTTPSTPLRFFLTAILPTIWTGTFMEVVLWPQSRTT